MLSEDTVPENNATAVITPTDRATVVVSETATAVMTPMDSTPIHPTIQTQLDSLSAGDLDRLMAAYHPEALVIFNKPLARLSGTNATATGRAEIESLLQGQIAVGTTFVELRDYVQGQDLAVVRSSSNMAGVPRDTFGYYLLRDGKIWRHVAGIYDAANSENAAMPATIHPAFMEQNGALAQGDVEGLVRTYDPAAIWACAANNSPISRVRGASQGHQRLREYLTKYIKLNMQMVALKEYTQAGDTLFVEAIMTARGMSEHASGAYVFGGNKILRHASSCGPRAS